MRARQHAVMDRQLVGEVAALGDLDGIDLADEIGDGDVRRGELLAVAPVARQPRDGRAVALGGQALAARLADRRQRIVVDLAATEHGDRLVEQADEESRDAGLRLAALAEEDDVLAAEDGVLDLRDDRLVVADDAGQERSTAPELRDEIVAQLLLDRLASPTTRLQLADRPCLTHRAATMRPRTRECQAE